MKSTRPKIVILVHQDDDFDRMPYLLREMAELWCGEGICIEVQRGLGTAIEADLVILHVDLTVVPEEYLALARKCPRVINGVVSDISKSSISNNILNRSGDSDGPVIVKTDRNCGGIREARLERRAGGLRKLGARICQKLPWSLRSHVSNYRIFPSSAEVPRTVWLNPNLVVERFQPERQNGYYCLRTWVFFGDRETNSLSYSNEPIVKSSNVIRREPVDEIPPELRALRKQLGFDFGKFDYAIVNGSAVLYDANRTPTAPAPDEQSLPRLRHLAEGIEFYLKS